MRKTMAQVRNASPRVEREPNIVCQGRVTAGTHAVQERGTAVAVGPTRAIAMPWRFHDSPGMSCASCGGDPRLVTSRSCGCGFSDSPGAEPYTSSSLLIAGMDINADAGDVACGELERGRHGGMDAPERNAARQDYVEHVDKLGMCTKILEEECWAETRNPLIGTRWVDAIKHSDGQTFIRSRLVARDFFASTPPLVTLMSMLPRSFR